MTPRAFLHQLGREIRGARGRMAFFALCLAVGVAGVTGVAGFSASLRQGLRSEARQLLAADLRVHGLRPLPGAARRVLDRVSGIRTTELREMPTVVAAPLGTAGAGRSQLVELRAVDGDYPFYGKLVLDPARPLAELLHDDGAVAAPELFDKLRLKIGDHLAVGGKLFTLRGIVRAEPDRIGGGFTIGPRLFVEGKALESTGLLAFGSRVEHTTLVALPPGTLPAAVTRLAEQVRAALPDPTFYRIETFVQGQPQLRRGVDRAERFLGLAALLSLLVGGVGVAQAVRAWLSSRLEDIAVLKTLGARPREIALLFATQIVLLALVGSAVGVLFGVALEFLLPRLAAGFLPNLPPPTFQAAAVGRGLALGAGVALLFALGPLLAALRVPALRVLRRDAEPIPLGRLLFVLLGVTVLAGTFAVAALQAASWVAGAAFAGGLALTAGLLFAAARGLARGAARVPRLALPTALRWSLAAFSRRGGGTTANVVALGLGALVLVGMASVERNLQRRLQADLPKDAPTAFLIDIQPSEWGGVQKQIAAAGALKTDSVPLVMARLSSIDGRSVEELAKDRKREGRAHWALGREQRLTWLRELPPDNQIVAGKLWSDPKVAELSVEEEFARDLGLHLGSHVTFDVQGVPVKLVVTSLRKVRWESFGINFFWVVEPGVLDDAPQMRIASVRLPPGGEDRLRDALAATFPNVTLFAVRDILNKVVAVLDKIGVGVRFLGLFTIVAGAAILAGAVAATAARRGREVAIAKALGMTRGQVVTLFAGEYGVSGFAGGLIGALAGSLLAWIVSRRVLDIPWHFELRLVLAAALGTGLLAVAAGLAASLRPLAERPIEALRSES